MSFEDTLQKFLKENPELAKPVLTELEKKAKERGIDISEMDEQDIKLALEQLKLEKKI